MAMAIMAWMKTMAAGQFKDRCLKTLDEVAKTKSAVVITKRGRPVAKLVPITSGSASRSLAGSILEEHGDQVSTGLEWDAHGS